jgi:hypothetical protein
MAWVIAPEMAIADGTANAHLQSRNDSKNNNNWHTDQQLIDSI